MRSLVMLVLVLSSATAAPAQTSDGRHAFDVTGEHVARLDPDVIRWSSVRTHLGGVEGEMFYGADDADPAVCRAAALLGSSILQRRYAAEREATPVTLGLDLRCGDGYEARLRYDGVNSFLEVRDRGTGEIIYQARRRGLPAIR